MDSFLSIQCNFENFLTCAFLVSLTNITFFLPALYSTYLERYRRKAKTFRNLPNKSVTFSVLCLLSRFAGAFHPRLHGNAEVMRFKKICGLCRNVNPLTPNDSYSGRTAPLTSKRCILYNYSTNIDTEYFKHDIYSQFFLFKMQFVS